MVTKAERSWAIGMALSGYAGLTLTNELLQKLHAHLADVVEGLVVGEPEGPAPLPPFTAEVAECA